MTVLPANELETGKTLRAMPKNTEVFLNSYGYAGKADLSKGSIEIY